MNLDKLKDAIEKLADKIGLNQPLRDRAVRRNKAFQKKAFKANEQKKAAQKAADKLRAEGHPVRASRKDKKALRLASVATKNHNKAIFWLGRVKALTQRIEGINTHKDELEAELKKAQGNVKIDVKKNKVTGGTARERLKAAALLSASRCGSNKRANFYSQPGSFGANKCFTGEHSGERSDCSQWFASVYKACGLPDPSDENYAAGFTGTLIANGKQIRESELKPGDAIVYGSGTGFHVEMYVGPGSKTIGHGSPPIDEGTVNLLGNGDYRCFTYLDD